MPTIEDIEAALIRGRAVRPIKIKAVMFRDDDKACALGAIAIGLGYVPVKVDSESEYYDGFEYNNGDAHAFIEGIDVPGIERAWEANDDSFVDGEQITDPDASVIRYLRRRS